MQIPDSERPFSLYIPPDCTLLDKLSILDQLLHQCMVLKAFISKQNNSFGTINSDLIEQNDQGHLAFKTIKNLLKHLSISSESDPEDFKF